MEFLSDRERVSGAPRGQGQEISGNIQTNRHFSLKLDAFIVKVTQWIPLLSTLTVIVLFMITHCFGVR